jgi:site-specific DNA-adenine methylase
MFSYYGSKSKIVDYYPPPKHRKIIEPFAGSARYSLKYWENDVLIVDKYNVIVEVWHFLKNASKQDILRLPNLKKGDDLRNFDLSDIEKKFLGFVIKSGDVSPKNIVCANRGDENQIKSILKNIANQLFKIKHWEIKQGCYTDLKNETATWFIDPPYQFGGEHYKENTKNIDFSKLSEWCMCRNGQVIVCENTKADWLPFKPMKEMQGTMFKTTEAIWSNLKTNYDSVQQSLF